MVVRRLFAAAGLAALLGVPAAGVGSTALGQDGAPSTPVYRLQEDPRACPSPICGGFWASRVNRAQTLCPDGELRASCYAADVDLSALPATQRDRVASSLGHALVRGQFAPGNIEGFPQLWQLVVSEAWLAATNAPGTGLVYRATDNGVRCITSPCFSLRAAVVNANSSTTLSDLDLAGVRAPALTARARKALTTGGLLVAGTIRVVPKAGPAGAGRALGATQFWLPARL